MYLKYLACFTLILAITFSKTVAQVAKRYDVIIDEVLANAVPVVGLPNAEYIELKNMSGKSINLQGWRVKSLTTQSAAFPSYILPADSFLIVTGSANNNLFTSFGRVLAISSFPSMINTGTTVSLISKEGSTIHSVSYNNSWFKNDVKSNGGWSLEMIDTHNPCTGFANWIASSDAKGGTPGSKNSRNAINPDNIKPALVRAAAIDSVTILLTYSETVDSTSAANNANYVIDGMPAPISAASIAPFFLQTKLSLASPLQHNKVYTITANNISDCCGNLIQATNTTPVGIAENIDSFNIIINEVLFNPKTSSNDYVEIYNRSNKILNLKDVFIANRSLTSNALGTLHRLTSEDILFFPGDFYVISESGSVVKQNYVAKNPNNFIDVTMPSFPDDEGVVVITTAQGKIVDEVHYTSKWHSAIIDNNEGISLERIDYNKPTQNKDNWTSAASSVGFGSPSYQNSQFRSDLLVPAEVTIVPKIFSPDHDGFDDFTTINIKMADPGYVANITIVDASGRPVKELAKNATLGSTGNFVWDGLNKNLTKVPVGVYIVLTELFNLNGKKRSFKNTVVVAARF